MDKSPHRFLGSLLAICFTLFPVLCLALGVGHVSSRSYLNEPLRAEIPLRAMEDIGLNEIKVKLASPKDFHEAGLERAFMLTKIQFEVTKSSDNEPVILLTTKEEISEPFLNFLIEIKWPSGQMLKEYTLLLDLPKFSKKEVGTGKNIGIGKNIGVGKTVGVDGGVGFNLPKKALSDNITSSLSSNSSSASLSSLSTTSTLSSTNNKLLVPGSGQGSEQAARHAPIQAPVHAPDHPSHFKTQKAMPGGVYEMTQVDDTLWEISKKLVKSSNASIHQGMIAIYQKNPEAFIRGNINLLKGGVPLSLPTESELSALSAMAAKEMVQEHNIAWRTKQTLSPSQYAENTAATTQKVALEETGAMGESALGREQDDALFVSSSDFSEENAAPLKLVAPLPKEAVSKTDLENRDLNKIAQRMALVEESLDTLERNNQTLTSQQQVLQKENSALNQLLQRRNQEIEALKQSMSVSSLSTGSQNKRYEMEGTEAIENTMEDIYVDGSKSHFNAQNIQKAHQVGFSTGGGSNAFNKTQENHPSIVTQALPSVALEDDDDVLVSAFANLQGLWIIALGSLISVFLLLVWSRRRKSSIAAESGRGERYAKGVQEFKFVEAVQKKANAGVFPTDVASEAGKGQEKNPLLTPKIIVDNAISDAKIYIAYEHFEQAEGVLKNAIKEVPEAWCAYQNLIELYLLMQRQDDANALFEALPEDFATDASEVYQEIQAVLLSGDKKAGAEKTSGAPLPKSKSQTETVLTDICAETLSLEENPDDPEKG